MRERNFSRGVISCATTTGCDKRELRVVEPSKRVIVRPSSFAKQILGRRSDEIDQLAVERFLLAEGLRVGHRRRGQVDVASALAHIAAQIGGGFVHDFLVQRVVHLRPAVRRLP